MELQKQLQIRKIKGLEIAKTGKINLQGNKWRVPSQSINKYYDVTLKLDKSECNCPDYQERQIKCKHIFAVELTVSKSLNQDGSVTVTHTKRITYAQNWKAYDIAQTNEKTLFLKLLSELCEDVEEPLYKFGRPRLPLKNMVFASALKVYSTFSLRRFMSDFRVAVEKGYATNMCSYRSVSGYMQSEELTPVLLNLITLSSIPLKSVETQFAVDSTGLRTTRFNEYCKEAHNTDNQHQWIKLHICCGVKTNIITAVEVGLTGNALGNDYPNFIPLTTKTYESGFDMKEVSADKAYSGRTNLEHIKKIGGIAFIPFRSNARGRAHGHGLIWGKMYNYFTYNQEEFMQHYHMRSNVESTFSMLKAKFTDLVRSKDKIAQINEVLLKVLCHNIVVLIHEMQELGIEPNFLGE
jgi:transposase